MLLILVLCNDSSNYKVVESPAWRQFNMPATIEELQGVVAGLSEVVKGLVGAIQLQAQSTTSHADSTSAPLNSNLTTLRLPTLQLANYPPSVKTQKYMTTLLNFCGDFKNKRLIFLPPFACPVSNNSALANGHILCFHFVAVQKASVKNRQTNNWRLSLNVYETSFRNPPTQNVAVWQPN